MLKRDEREQVSEVLERMYETDVIGQKVTRDLGLDDDSDQRPDPRTKMQLRHQQVLALCGYMLVVMFCVQLNYRGVRVLGEMWAVPLLSHNLPADHPIFQVVLHVLWKCLTS